METLFQMFAPLYKNNIQDAISHFKNYPLTKIQIFVLCLQSYTNI